MLTLDGKGRLTVPSRWREMLVATVGGKLVVTKSRSGCLTLYPAPAWEQFEAALIALPAEAEEWRRFFLSQSEDVEIDSASRVLIPPALREWAGLEREVKFMGMGAYFELWDKTRHDASEAETRNKPLPESLRNLVIR